MTTDTLRDVMQVCLRGHVQTDLLYTHPEQGQSHCDRCGSATLSRCPTCGRALPGAIPVPGFVPIGQRRAPESCPDCGARLPWAARRISLPPSAPLAQLEKLLRRLPLAVRQFRYRHGNRPAFVIADIFDLQDMLRGLLQLHCDEVYAESRTPSYAMHTRTDFVLAPEKIAVTCKLVTPGLQEDRLEAQLTEDVAYYAGKADCNDLAVLLYDPEQRLHDPRRLEQSWNRQDVELTVHAIVAT